MTETLKKTVDRLPAIMVKNARAMMRRMVAAMVEEMGRNSQDATGSYSSLLLKVSEADLVDAFEVAVKDAMAALAGAHGHAGITTVSMPLALEIAEESDSSEEDFASSAAIFKGLRANAKKVGVAGIGPFNHDIFLTALKSALVKSRIDKAEIGKLMPYARRALNRELLALYDKLNTLTGAPSVAV